MVWVIVGLALALAIMLMCLSQIKIKIGYARIGTTDHYSIHVRAVYGLVRLKFDKPTKSKQSNDVTQSKAMKAWQKPFELLNNTADLLGWARQTLKHVTCTLFQWHTSVGWSEAHFTAISAGLIWALKGSFIGIMAALIDLQASPELQVHPTYNTNYFSTDALCIVKIRFGYAMLAGLLLIIRIVKVKGGIRTWKNILFKA